MNTRPCPECGARTLLMSFFPCLYWIVCEDCQWSTKAYDHPENAIRAWQLEHEIKEDKTDA